MILDPILDIFRGRAITIPPLDGAFRPDTALDDAPVFAELAHADNLCEAGGRLFASSGNSLYALDEGEAPRLVETFAAHVTALAAAPDGTLAVALDDGSLVEGGNPVALPKGVACITALAYAPDRTLWLANGSDRHPASGWVADFIEKNSGGSVWRRRAGRHPFARRRRDLQWPYGLLPVPGGAIVSESWRRRLVQVGGGDVVPVLEHLPGYPARLSSAADGGAWLAIFAPCNRLIELVLQEPRYRHRHDGGGAARILDRAGAVLGSELPGAAAMWRHPNHGRAQGLGTEPVVRPRRSAWRRLRSARQSP